MVPEVLAREDAQSNSMSRLAVAPPVVCALFLLTLASAGAAQQSDGRQAREDWSPYLPPGEGQALVISRCTGCHDLKGTIQLRKPAPAWEAIVLDMGARGAPMTLDEIDPIVKYPELGVRPERSPVHRCQRGNQGRTHQAAGCDA